MAGAGTLLAMVAYTAPLGTLPDIAADLGAGPSGSAWIVSSTSLGLAVALIPAGALGDDAGRRRVFAAGAALLAAAALLGALAGTVLLLVAARLLQGVASGAVIACGLGLIGHAFPSGRPRTAATGRWGASLGAGIAAGPVLSAVLGWRPAYWLLAVLSALLAGAAVALVAESTAAVRRGPDIAGALLLASGLGCLLGGLTEGRQGWGRATALGPLAAAVLLLAAFAAHQLRARAPMLDLRAFRRPVLRAATLAAVATGLGVIAMMSFLPTLLQRGLGYGATASAVLLTAWSATSVVTASGVRRLPKRLSGRARLAGGLLGIALGILLLGGVSTGSGAGRLLAGLLVAGLASGVVNATLGREAVASVPPDQAGTGSAINNTARYVGAALGLTLVAALAGRPGAAQVVAGWNEAVWICAALTVLGAAAVAWRRTPRAT